jgi:mono/diheme cytochrome c family protein
MKRLALMSLFAAGFVFVAPVQASPEMVAKGQKLHEEKCAACHVAPHDAKFYTSHVGKDLKSKASLNAKVQACANHFNIDWFDDDVAAVTDYLNTTYYKLK